MVPAQRILIASTGRSRILISEAIEPGETTTSVFDKWCSSRMEHLSSLPGWKRTSRFTLVFKKENKDDPEAAKNITPKSLVLHEFDVDSIDDPQVVLGSSEETQRIVHNAKKVDVAAFGLLRGFGEKEGCWVEGDKHMSTV